MKPYYGGEGEAPCTCRNDKPIKSRMTCPYHSFIDLQVARQRGVQRTEEFVKARIQKRKL